jgi:hypothetical protein
MNEWAVAGFVSRVAERVSTTGEGWAAQLVDRLPSEFDADDMMSMSSMFPYVEPSPEFVLLLRQQLREVPLLEVSDQPRFLVSDRRVVYGVAAFGSIASAAVVAMLFLRARAANRPAA